jgi:hypothetical protein
VIARDCPARKPCCNNRPGNVRHLISALFLLMLAPVVWAEVPDAPTVDKKFVAVAATEGAAQALDAWYTARIIGKSGIRELNPLLGAHPSTTRLISTNLGVYASEIFFNYELKKRKTLRKLWWVPALGISAAHAVAVVHNSRY